MMSIAFRRLTATSCTPHVASHTSPVCGEKTKANKTSRRYILAHNRNIRQTKSQLTISTAVDQTLKVQLFGRDFPDAFQLNKKRKKKRKKERKAKKGGEEENDEDEEHHNQKKKTRGNGCQYLLS